MSTPSDFGLQSPTYHEMSASGLVKTGTGRLFSGLALTAGQLYNFGNVLFGTGLYIALTNVADWTVIYF